jgi:ABC-2 type transport system ATP-binding protein
VHALYRAATPLASRAAKDLLLAFGLAAAKDRLLCTLSRGQRRQAAIVAGLSLGTRTLLIDEATVALDPAAVSVLGTALRERAAAGAGVLVATQDLAFAEAVCDAVVVLQHGVVVADGTVAEVVRSSPSLELAYQVLVLPGASTREEGARARELAAV